MSASGWPAAAPGLKRFLGKPLRLGQVAAQECFTCAVKEGEPPQARLSEVVSESTRPPEVPLSRLELTVHRFVEPLEIRCPELERRIARLPRPRAELLDERRARALRVSGPVRAGIAFRSTFASARGSPASRASASALSTSARRRSWSGPSCSSNA